MNWLARLLRRTDRKGEAKESAELLRLKHEFRRANARNERQVKHLQAQTIAEARRIEGLIRRRS